MNVLVLNCGSSTLKFQIIETDADLIGGDDDQCLARGVIERIGTQALISMWATGQRKVRWAEPIRNHRQAIDRVLRWIISPDSKIEHIQSLADIHAVGHRVVHGGERFQKSVRIDDEVIEGIEDCIELAPLHNPANLRGIRAAIELLGTGVPQVAVFDRSLTSTTDATRSAATVSTEPRTVMSPTAIGAWSGWSANRST
jgi:acetate kinase